MLKQGDLRAEKVQYPDGVGCCIWRTMLVDDEEVGPCFDFLAEEIDDLLALLRALKDEPAREYEPEDD